MCTSQQPSVVIVGGGFAGVTLAQNLERRLPRDWQVVLLSRENYITYNPMLAEVVGASILPGHVVAPIRQMIRRTQFRMVDVKKIDLRTMRIKLIDSAYRCGDRNVAPSGKDCICC